MGLISARCYLISTVLVGIFAVLTLVIGIVGPIYLNSMLDQGIEEEILNTGTDSPAYKRWQDNTKSDSAAIFMKFYLWNITNPDEIVQGANPVVEEVGPYVYREYNIYLNVGWNDDKSTMNWTKWQYFVYSPEDSFEGADPYNDIFTTVNVPLMSVIGALTFNQSYETLWWKTLAYDFLASYTNEELFFQINANDLLFGYNDSMLSLAAALSPDIPAQFYLQLNMTNEEDAMKYSGVNMVDTGKKDITNIGSFITWHNTTSVGCWGNVEANTVIGNDATQFRPGIKKGDLPKVWVDQLFRMVEIQGTDYTEVKGIKVIEFTIPAEGYMNATEYPANAAYWQFWQPGVGNLTACEKGAPVFMSKPHFLDAPYFLAQITGMNPNREQHDTFVYVEPTIGECFRAYKRLQLNIRLQPDPILYPQLNNNYLVPVMWAEEGGELTDQQAEEFKGTVYRVQQISTGAKYGGLALGAVLVLLTSGLAIKTYQLYKRRADGIDKLCDGIEITEDAFDKLKILNFFDARRKYWEENVLPYLQEIANKNGKLNVLEIGVCTGSSTKWIFEKLIQPYPGSSKLSSTAKMFAGYTVPALIEIAADVYQYRDPKSTRYGNPSLFDFIYVDGGHSKSELFHDLAHCWTLLKKGGMMILDDYITELNQWTPTSPQLIMDPFLFAYEDFIEKKWIANGQVYLIKAEDAVFGNAELRHWQT